MTPGSIVAVKGSTTGMKWRVVRVEASGLVIAEDVDAGTVSHFDATHLVVVEPWPGGRP